MTELIYDAEVNGHRVTLRQVSRTCYRVTVDDYFYDCPDEGYPRDWGDTCFNQACWALTLPDEHSDSWRNFRATWQRLEANE